MEEPSTPNAGPVSLLGLGKPWTRVGHGVFAIAVAAPLLAAFLRPITVIPSVAPLKPGQAAPVGTTIVPTALGSVALPPGFQAEVRGKEIQVFPNGYRIIGGPAGGAAVLPTPLGVFGVFMLVFSPLTAFVWTIVDVVDRRKRFVWLLPLFVCPFFYMLQVLPFALYLFYGREVASTESGVQ